MHAFLTIGGFNESASSCQPADGLRMSFWHGPLRTGADFAMLGGGQTDAAGRSQWTLFSLRCSRLHSPSAR